VKHTIILCSINKNDFTKSEDGIRLMSEHESLYDLKPRLFNLKTAKRVVKG